MNDNNPIESQSLLRQIKLQIHKERLLALTKAHQNKIAIIAIVAILIALLLSIFSWYNHKQSEKYSAILHQSMVDEQNGNLDKSAENLKEIYQSSAPAGVKQIAALKYASGLMKSGKNDQAVAIYLAINKDKKFDNFIREYSGLIALKALVDNNKKDDYAKINELATKLEKESKTLKHHILEQKALFLWNSGDFKSANEIFSNLASNPEASEVLKKRTAEMVSVYKSKFATKPLLEDQKNQTEIDSKNDAKQNQEKATTDQEK